MANFLFSLITLVAIVGTCTAGIQRVTRDADDDVSNEAIRDALLELLSVMRSSASTSEQYHNEQMAALSSSSGSSSSGLEKKIDNISTFLLRMNMRLESVERRLKRGGATTGQLLETLAQESFDILTLLPTYIENTRDAVTLLNADTDKGFKAIQALLVDHSENNSSSSVSARLSSLESSLVSSSTELKEVVIESGHMAETLFERVSDSYADIESQLESFGKVERVLLETADSVMDTKRKVEFGVQQIIFKVSELVELSGGKMDAKMKDQFADITRTILSNQTEALANLTKKVEKEIGQVWRQMGIMYGQVSNSIGILEKVKESTEHYVSNTGNNLGAVEGQVEGLTDRIVDVDSNLNYMLGQLSLVVQEFNQVKTGLSDAMDGLGEELEDIKEYKPDDQ